MQELTAKPHPIVESVLEDTRQQLDNVLVRFQMQMTELRNYFAPGLAS